MKSAQSGQCVLSYMPPMGDLRKRQIDTLKIFNDNVVELKPGTDYSVGFESAGRNYHLDVFLTPNFPNDKPTLVLSPTINHPWVQYNTGVIQNAPGLLNFTIHSDLGRVVRAVIGELERFIIQLCISDGQNSSSSSSSPPSSTSTPTTNPILKSEAADYANTFHGIPDLTSLSLDELNRLAGDDSYLYDFVEELDCMHSMHTKLDTLLDEVKHITEENLSKADVLDELQTATQRSQNTMRMLGDRYKEGNRRYQEKAEQFAPNHIKELLQIAVSTAESEGEHHVGDLLAGKIDAPTFLERYIKVKVSSTVRKAKEDRLTHQLNALERAGIF